MDTSKSAGVAASSTLDLHHLLLLSLEEVVDLDDVLVRQLLDPLYLALGIVLAQVVRVLSPLDLLIRFLPRVPNPTLIVWGREDRIVPIAQSARLRAALPEAGFRPIDGCGHMPHFERPGHVNALLAEFLK